jgi:hypothetical protein
MPGACAECYKFCVSYNWHERHLNDTKIWFHDVQLISKDYRVNQTRSTVHKIHDIDQPYQ